MTANSAPAATASTPAAPVEPEKPDAPRQPQNLAELDAAKLKAAGNAPEQGTQERRSVKFIAKAPGLVVRFGMGDKDTFTFDEKGELLVTKKDAARLHTHAFKDQGLYVEAGTVMRTATGATVQVDPRDRAAVKAGAAMFYFPEKSILEIHLPGNEDCPRVRFVEHKACVQDESAKEALRKHMFFVQGRMLELQPS